MLETPRLVVTCLRSKLKCIGWHKQHNLRRRDKVYFRSSGKDAAEAETAQGIAVEGGEESISLALILNPICKL